MSESNLTPAGVVPSPQPLVSLTTSQEAISSVIIQEPAQSENEEAAFNLWDNICQEYEIKKYGYVIGPSAQYTPSVVAPQLQLADILSKYAGSVTATDADLPEDYRKYCTPREFLERYIFPTLLPAMEALLRQAKLEQCFERKRTKFNSIDFLTEYLYIYNPNKTGREYMQLWQIPFVKDWRLDHPRKPLPLSLLWGDAEAATVIQSHWRGYQVRRDSEVQELRRWQREWREINGTIGATIDKFWEKKMSGPPHLCD